jgi:tape measure domain-containing protein
MADLAELTLRIKSGQAEAAAERTTKALARLDHAALAVGRSMKRMGVIMTAAVTAPIALGARAAIRASAEFEKSRIAFGVFVGDMAKGERVFERLQQFAAKTPLNISGLSNAAGILLGTGVAAEDLMDVLKNLGNAARGDNSILQRLALNLAQVKAQGKLTGRELRDFAVAPVPLVQELAKQFGKTTAQIKEMVSSGKIGFGAVVKAFKTMSSEGGRFEKLLSKMSQTLTGKWTTAIDNIRIAMAGLVDPIRPQLKAILDQVIKWSQAIQALSDNNKKLIVAFLAVAAALGPVLIILGSIVTVIAQAVIASTFLGAAWPAIVAGIVPALLALTKFVAVIAAIVTAVEGLRRLFGATWAEIGKGLLSFGLKAIGFFVNFRDNWSILVNWLGSTWSTITGFLAKNWRTILFNMVTIVGTVVKNIITNFKILMNKISVVVGFAFGFIFGDAFKRSLNKTLTAMGKWAKKVFAGIVRLGKEISKVMAKALIGLFTGIKLGGKSPLDNLFEGFKIGKNAKTFKEGLKDALKTTKDFVNLTKGAKTKPLIIPKIELPDFKTDIFEKKFDLSMVPHGPEGPGVPEGLGAAATPTASGKAAAAFEAGTEEAFRLLTGRAGGADPEQKTRQRNRKANEETAKATKVIATQGVKFRDVNVIESFA